MQPEEQSPESIQSSKTIRIAVVAAVITALIVGGGVYAWQSSIVSSTQKASQQQINTLNSQLAQLQQAQQQIERPVIEEPNPEPVVDPTADWLTYTNSEYGFEVKYPAKYDAIFDDYGWPNSVIHFIQNTPPGAQAYQATISVWDNPQEYADSSVYEQMKYSVHSASDKYIYISYNALDTETDLISEWQQIASTFSAIE